MNRKQRRAANKGAHVGKTVSPNLELAFADAVRHFQAGRAAQAAEALAPVVRAMPDSPDVLTLEGFIALESGQPDRAAAAFRRALEFAPGDPGTLNNLGNALRQAGRLEEAAEAYRESLRQRPGHADTAFNLGVSLEELADWIGAESAYRESLAAAPADPAATLNLGRVLLEQRRLDEALPVCERAAALDPKSADAHGNLARAASSLGLIDRAEAAALRAVAIDADHATGRQALGMIHFLRGRWTEAWREYETRWRTEIRTTERPFRQPVWAGEPLAGTKILIWGEQGVGDEILFGGMVPDTIAAADRVVLECDGRLLALFRRSFPDAACVARSDPPAAETLADDIDFQVPIGSLGQWLRRDENAFPRRPSFLVADRALQDRLSERYRDGTKDRLIGVSWASVGPDKSMPIESLAPLFEVPGLRFVDLQYGDWQDARAAFERATGKRLIHDDTVDPLGDLDPFAAQVAAMDLVVSISSTAVHMAGALGVPAWVMLPTMPMWRWGWERDDSPWYPSVRLFRQRRSGDWADVVARIKTRLVEFASGRK